MHSAFSKVAAREQYRILVADDSSMMRNVFHSLSATSAVAVRAVMADRASLIHGIANHSDIDAVLCADHISGARGGIQALSELRSLNKLPPQVGFILMSADASKSNMMASIEARPDGILLKPFSAQALLTKLQVVVRRQRELAPLRKLAAEHKWSELLQLATYMLDKGTDYPDAVNKLKLDAAARLHDSRSLQNSYAQLLAAAPESLAVLEAQARLAYSQQDYATAENALRRMLSLQPPNRHATDLLIDVFIAKEDFVAAQRQLQAVTQHASTNSGRHRLLGHLALLNGDTLTASRAYLAAMRLQTLEAGVLDELDAINAIRALVLHEDNLQAWQVVTTARKARPDSKALDIIERMVETRMYRSMEAFRRSQQRIVDVIAAMGQPLTADIGPLRLAVIEASLITILVHPAYRLSKTITSSNDFKLHPLQVLWARKLEKWALATESTELPQGMQHFYKFI